MNKIVLLIIAATAVLTASSHPTAGRRRIGSRSGGDDFFQSGSGIFSRGDPFFSGSPFFEESSRIGEREALNFASDFDDLLFALTQIALMPEMWRAKQFQRAALRNRERSGLDFNAASNFQDREAGKLSAGQETFENSKDASAAQVSFEQEKGSALKLNLEHKEVDNIRFGAKVAEKHENNFGDRSAVNAQVGSEVIDQNRVGARVSTDNDLQAQRQLREQNRLREQNEFFDQSNFMGDIF